MLDNEKKNIYIQLMVLVCQNCTLIFSRTRKQNWVIICQCFCVYGGRGGGGGLEVLKYFVRGGQILTCFVCVMGGGGGGSGSVPLLP